MPNKLSTIAEKHAFDLAYVDWLLEKQKNLDKVGKLFKFGICAKK